MSVNLATSSVHFLADLSSDIFSTTLHSQIVFAGVPFTVTILYKSDALFLHDNLQQRVILPIAHCNSPACTHVGQMCGGMHRQQSSIYVFTCQDAFPQIFDVNVSQAMAYNTIDSTHQHDRLTERTMVIAVSS